MEKGILLSIESELASDVLPLIKLLNSLAMVRKELGEGAWVGFYVYSKKDDALLLGPFQGSPACERIAIGKGVVGASFLEKEDIYVKDVHDFPGYISCDAGAKSEAVFYYETAIFDIDSSMLDGLNPIDLEILKEIGQLLYPLLSLL